MTVNFTDGKSLRDQPVVDVRAEGSMLVIDFEHIEHTENTVLRTVNVRSTRTLIFPMSRVLNVAIVTTTHVGVEQ